jgi:hypothetical protein
MRPLVRGVARIEQRSKPVRTEKLDAVFFRPQLHDFRGQFRTVVVERSDHRSVRK